MTTSFFVGANSGEGFQNLFPEMVDLEDTYDFMILKGGAGVGKNTFMREIGRAMEAAGAEVEYLWCSGDPGSLDGVVFPQLRCAIADGTAPHAAAPLGHPAKKVSICKGLRRQNNRVPFPLMVSKDTFTGQAIKMTGITAQKI